MAAPEETVSKTIYERFCESVSRYPGKAALMFRGAEGIYRSITYRELHDRVNGLASSLIALGLRKGDTVGIFSHNRPEWAMADLAALKIGAIVVPFYPTLPPHYVKYIIADASIKLICVENTDLFRLIDGIRPSTSALKHVLVFDALGRNDRQGFVPFEEMIKSGPLSVEANNVVSDDDVATVVYTSGTTGEPKGVVLTHRNIISNALAIKERCRVTHKDVIVSYLPLSHMFERTCGYYSMLFAGATIAYARDMSTLIEDVAAIRPTILLVVPRVVEKAYDTVVMKVEGSSQLRRTLVSSAIRNLNTYASLMSRKMKIPLLLKVKCTIYNAFVASQFRKIAGGRLRIMASGGAPLDLKIAKTLHILGFNILEGYGLTETSPIVSCHKLEHIRLGTVGIPLDDVDVTIGENDEILVRGPNVMKGYLNRPEETAKVIDNNGWVHTGDQGRFDEDGNLIITGRIKELIVTSYGKKVASAPIEASLTKSRYIAQAVLYGDARKFIVALIVPDREAVELFAREKDIPYQTYPALLERDEIKELIQDEIRMATGNLASYEQVKAFALVAEEFTVENGLLTPTLKLKKGKIAERYHDTIESLYGRSQGGGR